MRSFIKLCLVFVLVIVVVFPSGCTPEEIEQIKGIVKSVDVEKGEITIVTEDGKEVTLSLDSETKVDDEEGSSDIEGLEAGASVQIDVNQEEQSVKSIKTGNGKKSEPEEDEDSEEETEVEAGTESESGNVEDEKEIGDGESIVDEKNTDGGTSTDGDTGTKEDGESGRESTGTDESEGDVKEATEEQVQGLIDEMEAERARLAEEIRVRTATGNVDEEWVKEVEAERARLAEEIRKIQEGEYKMVVIDGKVVAVTPEDPKEDTGGTTGDSTVEEDDSHIDDGHDDDHPDDGDDHPDDGDDDHHHD